MRVRSIGLATDLELIATRGEIRDRGDYLVAITPDDPGYYFGNLLVLPSAPQVGEVAYWTRRFADELGRDPAIKHVTLRWDTVTGDTGARDELLAAGFALEIDRVMTATSLGPATTTVAFRPLMADEVLGVAELGFAIGDRHDDVYRQFLRRRAAVKRALVLDDVARWWGAFDGATLVGSLGLVRLAHHARFQDVQVAASHRKRGIASALLAAAAAETTLPLVIVAQSDDAVRLYERAGFRTRELAASACRYPP